MSPLDYIQLGAIIHMHSSFAVTRYIWWCWLRGNGVRYIDCIQWFGIAVSADVDDILVADETIRHITAYGMVNGG